MLATGQASSSVRGVLSILGPSYTGSTRALGARRLGSIPSGPRMERTGCAGHIRGHEVDVDWVRFPAAVPVKLLLWYRGEKRKTHYQVCFKPIYERLSALRPVTHDLVGFLSARTRIHRFFWEND